MQHLEDMNASSSSLQSSAPPAHDIFLSHSSAQKGFVRDLCEELKGHGFCPFFDENYDSLPLGDTFPEHIRDAASSCKVALVILSDEYLSSYWPMIELCWFMHATPDVKILPIFFLLSPYDLKEENNKRKWLTQWESFAKASPRIVVSDWEKALKSLRSINGIKFQGRKQEGEKSFIKKIVQNVYSLVGPRNTYDTSYMKGADRHVQIILHAFETMESSCCEHELCKPQPLIGGLVSPRNGFACVLGIYGFPGSGKSTLCRRLFDYFSPQYNGNCFYLELPTNPTPSDLNDEIARTFGLTTPIAHIDKVMSQLKRLRLATKSIFLIVDNVCDKSYKEVQRILCSVAGPGTRVVVVARTHALLRLTLEGPLVQLEEGLICRCKNIPMPTITEDEATELLIEEATPLGSVHRHDVMKQKDKVLTVVRMCGFADAEYTNSSTSKLLYLPLVVAAMGGRLAKYEKDVDEWVRDQKIIWSRSENEELIKYKYDVVYQIIGESFKALNEEQQVLFLDVALFLQPSRVWEFHESCSMLASMHGFNVARIKNLLKDLERLCFIERLNSWRVHVHDVYVEFAKSIQEKKVPPNWSYLQHEDILCDGTTIADKKLEKENTQRPVRAITFEVKDGCEKIDLKDLSSLKALCLRECGSMVTLQMKGLTSLAILHITGLKVFRNLVCDFYSVQNVQRFILKYDRDEYLANAITNEQQEQENFGLPAQQSLSRLIGNMLCHVKMSGFAPHFVKQQGNVILPAVQSLDSVIGNMLRHVMLSSYVPHFVKQPGSWGLAKHMKNLQVLCLEHTGVRNLEDMGSCSWPHLQELHVEEYSLEGIKLGTLPALATFVLHTLCINKFGKRLPKMMVEGKDLLRGCTALQKVDVRSDLFRNVEIMKSTWRGLLEFRLMGVRSSMDGLVDSLASSTLQHLEIMYCNKIERVNFCAGQLPSLRELVIRRCPGIVEVEFGLQALPCLARLEVIRVSEMCVLSGLEGLRQLEELHLHCCPMLFGCTSFGGSVHLSRREFGCHSMLTIFCGLCRSSVRVSWCNRWQHRPLDSTSVELEKLSNLEKLKPRQQTGFIKLASDSNLKFFELMLMVRRFLEGPPLHVDMWQALEQVTSWGVVGVKHLRSLDGIQCLSHLQQLYLSVCPLLEELPSLHALHDLTILHIVDCVKLKAVRGCDELRKLVFVSFSGCESMEQVPFENILALGSTHPSLIHLDIRGCGFAKDTKGKLLMEWPAVQMSCLLSEALLCQLLWEWGKERRGAHSRTVCHEGFEDGCVKVKVMDLEVLEQTIVFCLQSLTTRFNIELFELGHEANGVLQELLLAGKLPEELAVNF